MKPPRLAEIQVGVADLTEAATAWAKATGLRLEAGSATAADVKLAFAEREPLGLQAITLASFDLEAEVARLRSLGVAISYYQGIATIDVGQSCGVSIRLIQG